MGGGRLITDLQVEDGGLFEGDTNANKICISF